MYGRTVSSASITRSCSDTGYRSWISSRLATAPSWQSSSRIVAPASREPAIASTIRPRPSPYIAITAGHELLGELPRPRVRELVDLLGQLLDPLQQLAGMRSSSVAVPPS